MNSILKPHEYHLITAAELIQKLDQQYPHRCIGPDQSVEHARFYAGKRDLIDSLLAKLNRYEDK